MVLYLIWLPTIPCLHSCLVYHDVQMSVVVIRLYICCLNGNKFVDTGGWIGLASTALVVLKELSSLVENQGRDKLCTQSRICGTHP